MARATLRMGKGKDCWDKLVLIVRGADTVVPLIHFKDRHSALDAYNQIAVAHFENHADELEVHIDGSTYTMTYDVWQAVGAALNEWYEDYMILVEGVGNFN